MLCRLSNVKKIVYNSEVNGTNCNQASLVWPFYVMTIDENTYFYHSNFTISWSQFVLFITQKWEEIITETSYKRELMDVNFVYLSKYILLLILLWCGLLCNDEWQKYLFLGLNKEIREASVLAKKCIIVKKGHCHFTNPY